VRALIFALKQGVLVGVCDRDAPSFQESSVDGMRGFTLNSEERDSVLLELDRAHGNREYALSLNLLSVLAIGKWGHSSFVGLAFRIQLQACLA